MSLFKKINDQWTEVYDLSVNDNSTWKSAKEGWVNEHGTWKKFYDSEIMYFGGSFGAIKEPKINRGITRLSSDISTFPILSEWNPDTLDTISTIAIDNSAAYIGGTFKYIENINRFHAAAISTNTISGNTIVLPWNPIATIVPSNPNILTDSGWVNTIVIDSGTIYIGGLFTYVGGAYREGCAAYSANPNTTNLLTWNPNLGVGHGIVTKFIINGSSILAIVGNDIISIPKLTSFNPPTEYGDAYTNGIVARFNNTIFDILTNGADIFACGSFTSVNVLGNSSSKNGLAVIQNNYPTASTIHAFSCSKNGNINSFIIADSHLYVGGTFTTLNSQTRNHIGAIDISSLATSSPTINAWNPDVNGNVSSIAKLNDNIYFSGNFSSVNGKIIYKVASVKDITTTFEVSTWEPDTSFSGKILINNSDVYLYNYNGSTNPTATKYHPRNNLAAISLDANLPLSIKKWNPNVDESINVLLVNNNVVYIGGYFNNVEGQSRSKLAVISSQPNSAITLYPWNPNLGSSDIVYTMILNGADIYIGGVISDVNGTSRTGLIALSSAYNSTHTLRAYDPFGGDYGEVYAMIKNGSVIYIGGYITDIQGNTRGNLAAISSNTGISSPTVHPWNPSCDGWVNTMLLDSPSDTMYIGGSFTTMNGQSRNKAAAVTANHTSIATLKNWNPDFDGGDVYIFEKVNSYIYVGGDFKTINATTVARNGASLFAADPTITTYYGLDPNFNDNDGINFMVIYFMLVYQDSIYYGGQYDTISGTRRESLTATSDGINSASIKNWAPNLFGKTSDSRPNVNWMSRK